MAMKLYFINLDRAPERAAFVIKQCNKAGIEDMVRVSATDAQKSDMKATAYYRPERWGHYWQLTDTEIAVFLSHRAIWERIAVLDKPAAVLEDDVILSHQLGQSLEMLEGLDDFEFIKLDAAPGRARLGSPQLFKGLELRPILQILPSAAAYVLSPSGARNILDRSKCYCDHVDDFLTRPKKGFRSFQLCPAMAIQGMFCELNNELSSPPGVAESERFASDQKSTPIHRGPATYRIYKELRRVIRRAGHKLGGDALNHARGGLNKPVLLSPDLPPYRRR